MILLLRFIGVMNAAIWFGSAVFVLVAAPVFFSPEIQATPLGKFWPGVMVQFVFERFFHLQYICGAVAIGHQLAEWVYLGRNLQRWVMLMLGVLLAAGLAEGLILEPKLRSLNLIQHGLTETYAVGKYTQAERIRATATFKTWHGISRAFSLLATAGLGFFLWKVVHPGDPARFASTPVAPRGNWRGSP